MPRLKNATHEKFAQLIALKHLSQSAAWLEAVGPERASRTSLKNCTAHANRVATYPSVRARVEEIQAENEQECRWGRKQLLDFYCDCLERGAGTLTPDDRLCQGIERTTVEHLNSKGEVVRTVTKERLIMPAKMEAAEGVRRMLGWDKRTEADVPDDITELMIMIRRKAIPDSALGASTDSIQPLEVLSSEHLSPLPVLPSPSEAST
jgi:hypothetical protein